MDGTNLQTNYNMLDLQNSIHHQHHQQQQQQQHPSSRVGPTTFHPPMHTIFPPQPVAPDRGKNSTSEDDDTSYEDGSRNKKAAATAVGSSSSPWQRMKWTDGMVRLLITAVSYLGEDAEFSRKKSTILQKKGKWKSISKVLAERGCYVSPQQCEDKFNDLNKRYKRLTEILGRGTSCKVVENPALLDLMDHVSEKGKDDVRKILSSKHLFYEEMCSYHNGNRLHLPADPALQRSLQLALGSKDEHERKRAVNEDGEDDVDSDEEEDDAEEVNVSHCGVGGPCFTKRTKQGMDCDEVGNGSFQEFGRSLQPQGIAVDMNQVFPEGSQADLVQKQAIKSRSLQLEEQSLRIEAEMLELEKQRFKWQRFSKKKDRDLDKMRVENKRMKLENQQLELELKRKQLGIDLN